MTATPTPPSQADREVALKRPQGNNADEWGVFLEEYEGCIPYVAVQIAEAIDAAAATRKEIDVGIKSLQMLGYRADGTPAADREAVREAVTAMQDAWGFIRAREQFKLIDGKKVWPISDALLAAIAKLGEE